MKSRSSPLAVFGGDEGSLIAAPPEVKRRCYDPHASRGEKMYHQSVDHMCERKRGWSSVGTVHGSSKIRRPGEATIVHVR